MKKFSCRLPVTAVSLILVQGVNAQQSTDEQIEELIVTASPIVRTQDQFAGSLNLISESELQRAAAANLGEALSGELGVSNSTFGPGVGVPVIRGQSGKRVEVLNDGVRVTDVSDTSADHAIAAEIGHIRQVEVIRGPATLRYGPGAIGGVVNLVERVPGDVIEQGLSGSLTGIYNDNSSAGTLGMDMAYGMDDIEFDFSLINRDSDDISIPGLANHEADDPDETTDGYIANTDAESTSYALGAHGLSENLEWSVEYKNLDTQYGIPPGAHEHDHHDEEEEAEEEEEHHEETFVRVDMQQEDIQTHFRFINPFDGIDSIDLDLAHTEYEHTELEIDEGVVEPGTYFALDATDLSVEALFSLGEWQSYSGIAISREDFVADGEEAFVPPSETSNLGIYWVQYREFSNYSLEIGGRYDTQEVDANENGSVDDSSVNLSASLLFPVGDESSIGLIISRAERAPSAEELFADGEHIATSTYEIGDISLDTETSNNLELTYRFDGAFSAQTSIFYNDFGSYLYEYDTELLFNHDLADAGATGLAACSTEAGFDDPEEAEDTVECFQYRQEGATFYGVETEATFALNDQFGLRIWADSVRAKLDDSGDVPRMPPARIGATLVYENENWYSSLAWMQAADQDRPGENQEATEGYTKVDAYLGYQLDNWNIYARVNNLLDEEIRNSTSFLREIAPEPGRSAILGVTYHF